MSSDDSSVWIADSGGDYETIIEGVYRSAEAAIAGSKAAFGDKVAWEEPIGDAERRILRGAFKHKDIKVCFYIDRYPLL